MLPQAPDPAPHSACSVPGTVVCHQQQDAFLCHGHCVSPPLPLGQGPLFGSLFSRLPEKGGWGRCGLERVRDQGELQGGSNFLKANLGKAEVKKARAAACFLQPVRGQGMCLGLCVTRVSVCLSVCTYVVGWGTVDSGTRDLCEPRGGRARWCLAQGFRMWVPQSCGAGCLCPFPLGQGDLMGQDACKLWSGLSGFHSQLHGFLSDLEEVI